MHKCINNSIGNVYHLEQFVSDFFPYSQKQLGFDKPVTIRFESDEKNSGVMLGKTAYYDPAGMEVVLYVDGRHPKDVMRSLSHELVHHAQNCRGDFTAQNNTGPGYAQSDPHLRKMEREAYTKGNLIFRDYEDLIKTGKKEVHIDFSKSGEPTMSLNEWKNKELNMLLMKKWGLLKEGTAKERNDEEDNRPSMAKDMDLDEGHEHGPECGCPDVEEGMKYRSEDDELEEILAFGSEREKAWRRIARGSDDPARGPSRDKPAGHRDYKPDPKKGEKDYGLEDEVDEAKRHVAGGHPDVADFIMPNAPKGKTPPAGQRIMDPRFLKDKTTKVPPVAVPGDDELDTRTRHLNRTKDGKLEPAVRDPEHPDAIRRENKKISVKEAKEITRKIIERIKKEGK